MKSLIPKKSKRAILRPFWDWWYPNCSKLFFTPQWLSMTFGNWSNKNNCQGYSLVTLNWRYWALKAKRDVNHQLFLGSVAVHMSKQHFSRCYARYFNWKLGAPRFKPGAAGWEARTLSLCYAAPPCEPPALLLGSATDVSEDGFLSCQSKVSLRSLHGACSQHSNVPWCIKAPHGACDEDTIINVHKTIVL